MSQADPVAPGPILVVGGRGFVGAAVVRHLVAGGRSVHVFGPDSPVALPTGATQTLGSIEDRHAVAAVIRAVRPAEVINLAAFSAGPVGLSRSGEADPERMLAVNVLGWRHLLDAVVNLDEDRILRRFLNLVQVTLRTNYFQKAADGTVKPYVSFKLDSQKIDELPLDRKSTRLNSSHVSESRMPSSA